MSQSHEGFRGSIAELLGWELYLDDFISEAENYPSRSGLPGPKYY